MLLLLPYLKGPRFTVTTDQDTKKWIWNSIASIGKLGHWQLRLSKFQFDVIFCAGIYHQGADELPRLKTTSTDQVQIDDDISVLCITPSPLENEETRVSYMHNKDVNEDKGVGSPAVYRVSTLRSLSTMYGILV